MANRSGCELSPVDARRIDGEGQQYLFKASSNVSAIFLTRN
jgi:hypothetical protein